MQAIAYLRPTVLQRLRAFLDQQAPLPPWTSAADVLDHLHALLYARRDDAPFWRQLEQLALDLQSDLRMGRSDGLPTHEAEVLSCQQIDEVLAELRSALRGNGPVQGPGAMTGLVRGRSPGLSACVAVLAAVLCAGCNPREPQTSSTLDGPGISADPNKELAADAGANVASDALVQLFRDGSPEDIAATLEAMVDGGVNAVMDASQVETGIKPAATGSARPPRPKPTVQPVPRYKGVTF